MFSSRLVKLAVATALLAGRVTAQCDSTEGPELLCYVAPDNVPQNVSTADVEYVAEYLRAYGAQTMAGRQFTMTAADAADCAEWTLYAHGTVLALAKHLNTTFNSSVLYSDIANTIDGGAGSTAAEQADAILGCGATGGSFGVVYNASNPQYLTAAYLADDYTPAGILIKIVSSGVTAT